MSNLFFERYSELCNSVNGTPNSIAKELGISSGSVTAWKNGTEPRPKTLSRIADFFSVSVDYLLGNVSEPYFYLDNDRILKEINSYGDEDLSPRKHDVLDEVDIAFYGEYKQLTEDDKATVRDMVHIMRERRTKKQE